MRTKLKFSFTFLSPGAIDPIRLRNWLPVPFPLDSTGAKVYTCEYAKHNVYSHIFI